MNLIKKFKNLILNDNNLPIRERLIRRILLVGTTIISIVIIQIFLTTSTYLTAIPMFGLLLLEFLCLILSYRYNMTELSAVLIGIGAIGVALPITFFLNGGVYSGAGMYFVLGIFYAIGMFNGKKMYVFLAFTIAVVVSCYAIAYNHPEYLQYMGSEKEIFMDSVFAVIMVGLLIGVVLKFQLNQFNQERMDAIDEKDKIQIISDARNSFFANMSHEIRTPINTIVGLNEVIVRDSSNSDQTKENARVIQNASQMLLSLVNDILDLSKIESAKMDILPTPYRTQELFTDLINMIQYQIESKNLDFIVDIDPKLPSGLFGDDKRIKQILINLLTNAAKYTQEGSVTLRVRFVNINSGFIKLIISIQDTGMGIRKENLDTLFDSFIRVDSNNTRTIEGTGLGLSISKQLIDLMDGTITVDSIYRKGSTFTVSIEQKIIDSAPMNTLDFFNKKNQTIEAYIPLFKAPEARILVVDDNEMNRQVIIKLLQDNSIQIDVAASGEQALKLTTQYAYNLILMDYLMPEMNGDEVTRAIRKQENGLCVNSPIIVVTADLSYCSEMNFDKFGFSDFIEKPFKGRQLEEKVMKFLPLDLLENVGEGQSKDNFRIYNASEHKILKKILITTDCLSDIPKEFLDRYDIKLMYLYINTRNSRYTDTVEINTESLAKSLSTNTTDAWVEAASAEDYERFFANCLEEAEQVIHISLAEHMGKSYCNALDAAKGFGHVTVIDSGQLSVGMGLMAIKAAQLAQEGETYETIMSAIDDYKASIRCAFIMPTTKIFQKNGYLNMFVSKFVDCIRIHPIIIPVNSYIKLRRFIPGNFSWARMAFIKYALKYRYNGDGEPILITQAGLSVEEQLQIKNLAYSITGSDKIYVQKCSVTNACNTGIGTIGIAFFT